MFIANSEGDFLAHPDPQKTFGFDLGKPYRMQDEIPALAPAFRRLHQQPEMALQASSGEHNELVQLVKAFFDPSQPNRFLAVVQSTPRESVTAEAAELRKNGFYTALALAVIGAILAFSFARLLIWPLQQITQAAALVSSGGHNARLPTQRQDEIGVLSRAFEKMLVEIREREQAIREGKTRLRATLDTVVNGIVTINERGIVDGVNPAVEHMFGYGAKELVGQNVSMLMPSEHAERHDSYIRNYIETGDKKVIGALRELTGQHKEGRRFPILLAVSETMIEGRRFFVGAIQDLTELQSSEERTRRLGKILETSTNEIFVFECPSLSLLESNLASRHNLGYAQERLAQMTLFDLFPDSEHARIEEALNKLEDSSSNEQQLDSLFRRKDGSLYPVELRLFASQGKDDTVGVVIAHDITERQQQLEKLRAYAQRLESSNRELQDFAFVASHDLQEPLRKVQAFGDRLKDNEAKRLSERGRDYIERMQRAAARMQILINDLLTLSRVTTKGRPFERVDLEQVAHEVMEDLEARIQDVGGRIDLGALPILKADPLQMRQLLQNLMANALKFHRPDIAPQVRIASELVNTTTNAPAQYRITIEDNGIGFDNQYADRIFTPFERLHSRQEYEGTGMGLALCRKIVERHGGTISAAGRPGEGTIFTITLPANIEV
jgi:two-component system sensor kinase FixL